MTQPQKKRRAYIGSMLHSSPTSMRTIADVLVTAMHLLTTRTLQPLVQDQQSQHTYATLPNLVDCTWYQSMRFLESSNASVGLTAGSSITPTMTKNQSDTTQTTNTSRDHILSPGHWCGASFTRHSSLSMGLNIGAKSTTFTSRTRINGCEGLIPY